MIDTTQGTTCADCGAAFPQPPASGGASGYALTRVPRFAEQRERIIGCDGGQRGTIRTGAPAPHNERDTLRFPAVFDFDREAKEAEKTDGIAFALPMRRICYACCATLERETMQATGRTCLYLVTREVKEAERRLGTIDRTHVRQTSSGPYFYRYELSNWPGSAGFRLLGAVRESHGYGFGRRYPVRTFRFAGPDGFVWCGRSAGDMDLARVRRTKERLRPSLAAHAATGGV